MTNRRMIVKFNGAQSEPKQLIGGSPQGTLLGGIEYIIANSDCLKESTSQEDRFKYYDDLNLLEFLILCENLEQYNFLNHVASDIGTDHLFLPPEAYKMQTNLNDISKWTSDNLMLINEKKSSYIMFNRSKSNFSTRLTLNGATLERSSILKVLGIWLQEDLKWDYNTKQICIKAYSRMNILNRLKYVGIGESDLITIYKMFIRSLYEYCCSVFHSSLTPALKIILVDKYTDYQSALMYFSIDSLSNRRQTQMNKFAIKCIQDENNQKLFPRNVNVKGKDVYHVNIARINQYFLRSQFHSVKGI